MARSYGRFTTTIWRDPDFTSLTLEQQGAYFTLGLQPDVTAAGLLPFTARRWAKLSDGTSRDRFEQLIGELSEHDGQHLVVDEDTEELLIRKFIKWDMGWANSKRLPVVVDAVRTIQSVHIRDIAVEELRRVVTWHMASPAQQEAVRQAVSAFDRVVVTEVGNVPQPLTATHDPATATPERQPAAYVGPPSMYCSKHPNGTEQPCGPCGTARAAYAAWVKSTAGAEADRRRAADEAKAAAVLAEIAESKLTAVPRPKVASA